MSEQNSQLQQVAQWMNEAQHIVVLTGAGISTDSGIPDFRGPEGVWTKDPEAEKMSNIRYYLSHPETRERAWKMRASTYGRDISPNAGHYALLAIERAGKLHGVITQNIDGLHLESGIAPEKLYEVHGTRKYYRCVQCGERGPLEVYLDRVRAGEADPPCTTCGGIVKTDVILFGEALVPEVIGGAMQAAEESDLFLAIGTTLGVGPVNGTVPRAKATGSRVVIINGSPTEMDHYADIFITGDISSTLTSLMELAGFPT
jgi:NAD-dependent deacetylase